MSDRETNSKFRFKQFELSHSASSMKIGVDGVLVGAWTDSSRVDSSCAASRQELRILDVGTGCGLIAAMMGQRFPTAHITAIDIHPDSVGVADENFKASPWADRLEAVHADIDDFVEKSDYQESFDIIVSNPPFFDSGIANPSTPRENARHQGVLSPISLLEFASRLLVPSGLLAFIAPSSQKREIISQTFSTDLFPLRICDVKGAPHLEAKRTLFEFIKPQASDSEDLTTREEQLTIRTECGSYSPEYIELTKDFYLAF